MSMTLAEAFHSLVVDPVPGSFAPKEAAKMVADALGSVKSSQFYLIVCPSSVQKATAESFTKALRSEWVRCIVLAVNDPRLRRTEVWSFHREVPEVGDGDV